MIEENAYQRFVSRLAHMDEASVHRSLAYYLEQEEITLRIFPNARGLVDYIGACRMELADRERRRAERPKTQPNGE